MVKFRFSEGKKKSELIKCGKREEIRYAFQDARSRARRQLAPFCGQYSTVPFSAFAPIAAVPLWTRKLSAQRKVEQKKKGGSRQLGKGRDPSSFYGVNQCQLTTQLIPRNLCLQIIKYWTGNEHSTLSRCERGESAEKNRPGRLNIWECPVAQKRGPFGHSFSRGGGLEWKRVCASFLAAGQPPGRGGLVALMTKRSPQHHGTTQIFFFLIYWPHRKKGRKNVIREEGMLYVPFFSLWSSKAAPGTFWTPLI